ncbi:uncharacterized protein N7496_008468 [Penicillium cataractarum]|uniref:Uncharacterized protein n=1 Tax=Penicillium cataractarum TaxID=2100454 RepID=A0A9W9V4K7_9EURO|nr:uncharacterized protein N7496_008468 [Penicillium cataractarum]KAJ5368708.1 hypothetical protein N7496_008468 [Penicillium cataractarum]
MVLGIAMMAAMLPTMIGLNEATQGARDQDENRRNTNRKQRCHLVATCSLDQGTPELRSQVHNAQIQVGLDRKLYITKQPGSTMAPFNGGFFTHPDFKPNNTSGLVTVTGEETPTLRWVFLDSKTHEMRWGGRPDTEGHVCGPFDWTKDEQYVTLEGWEGFLAVRLEQDDTREHVDSQLGIVDGREVWRLYFDQNDDGADLPPNAKGLEIRLKRVMAES